MNSQQLVRITLKMSVAFNFAGAYLLAFPTSYPGNLVNLPQNVPILYSALLSFAVFMFGVIYAWLSRQPNVFQPLLFVSSVAKICFFVIGAALWLFKNTSGEFVILLIGDLIFGSIWIWAFYSNRGETNA